jgi:hypothetical protein
MPSSIEDSTSKWGDTVSAPPPPLLAPCQVAWPHPATLHTHRTAPRARAQFKYYLFIEGCIWLPACYLCCYRFQPTVRFMQTDAGRAVVGRTSSLLERYAPKTHATLAQMAGKIHGTPAGRAAAEWALINKVLAPVGFPTKMWIAHKIVQSRAGTAAEQPKKEAS